MFGKSSKKMSDFNPGDRYVGEKVGNKPHGYGIAYLANGDTFKGQWVNGKRHGVGT